MEIATTNIIRYVTLSLFGTIEHTAKGHYVSVPSGKCDSRMGSICIHRACRYPWPMLRPLVEHLLGEVVHDFDSTSQVEVGPTLPLAGGETAEELQARQDLSCTSSRTLCVVGRDDIKLLTSADALQEVQLVSSACHLIGATRIYPEVKKWMFSKLFRCAAALSCSCG